MKTIEKYQTIEQLTSAEKATSDIKVSLKKHASFEMLLNKIYSQNKLIERKDIHRKD